MPSPSEPATPPLAAAWREALGDRRSAVVAAGSALFLVAGLALLAVTVGIVEHRPGARLPDPLLALFSARDLTWPIFSVIWASLLLSIVLLSLRPRLLFTGFRAYGFLALFRASTLLLTPLDPPAGMLALHDPFVEAFITAAATPTRDLFFSGHVGTLALVTLVVPERWARALLAAATAFVAAGVLLQKVHYTVDVVAAPAFAVAAVALARLLPRPPAGPPPGR